jgi:hypothetical protein
MTTYRLALDGDSVEREYWSIFIQCEFPVYESFWQQHIVPLTNRPYNIHFKSVAELNTMNKTDNDVCIAQLHYTVLIHFIRVFHLRSIPDDMFTVQNLSEGLIWLVSAQDLAFEILTRFKNSTTYHPWFANKYKSGGKDASQEARSAYQSAYQSAHINRPLQNIRDYRNNLAHGRMLPLIVTDRLRLPKIGIEDTYFDWRKVTDPQNTPGYNEIDFVPIKSILEQAWLETRDFVNQKWQEELLGIQPPVPVPATKGLAVAPLVPPARLTPTSQIGHPPVSYVIPSGQVLITTHAQGSASGSAFPGVSSNPSGIISAPASGTT